MSNHFMVDVDCIYAQQHEPLQFAKISLHYVSLLSITMFKFGNLFCVSLFHLIPEIFGFILRFFYRSNPGKDVKEDSVFMQRGLIVNNSKYEFISGKNLIEYVEEPKTVKFMVQEMFVGSNDELVEGDQSLVCENAQMNDSLDFKLENSLQMFDEESDVPSFRFKLFEPCWYLNEDGRVKSSQQFDEELVHVNIDQEKADISPKSLFSEFHDENEKLDSTHSEEIRFEGIDFEENEIMDDHDFSYEVELLPWSPDVPRDDNLINTRKIESDNKRVIEGFDFLETNARLAVRNAILRSTEEEDLDDDDEFIELEPQRGRLTGLLDVGNNPELHEHEKIHNSCWDSDSDVEEEDAISEHQNLVQQMKMELKICRIGGLPTISEESDTLKVFEDLKPLSIDQKFEYKDLMEEIQKFYKRYVEKMRKLDILNYQTLHAISFLQLNESGVLTASKKTPSSTSLNLSKICSFKDQKIHADPKNKSTTEMHHDLELVYVGQLCLSWEILSWLYVKSQELIEHDSKGNHSYNRVAEEFQQFQVMLQRFIENEPFQEQSRIQNYVKNRCMIRSLLQVPTIKDDCMKDKKEKREEKDMISLSLFVEIIWESMLIFKEFVFADKFGTNVVLKGILGTKIDRHDIADSDFLMDIIANLQKKDRRLKEQKKSQNCIVKKLQKHHAYLLDHELCTSQVELRLVSRVLGLSRLTPDQLEWCQMKLRNISFVRKKVHHVEPSFLVFPC